MQFTEKVRRVFSLRKYTTLNASCICNARILQILKEYELEANIFTRIKNTFGFCVPENNKLIVREAMS